MSTLRWAQELARTDVRGDIPSLAYVMRVATLTTWDFRLTGADDWIPASAGMTVWRWPWGRIANRPCGRLDRGIERVGGCEVELVSDVGKRIDSGWEVR